MEKYFKPVQCPAELDEIKPRKNRHHHKHHLHHYQDTQSHRYAKFDDTDRNTDDSQGQPRHHQHSHYLRENPHHNAHYPRQYRHSEEDEILYDHRTPVTLSRASSSSLSSSSSSSWYTESSANDPFTLRHAERPQHSLSCSNIPDVRIGFQEDDNSEPIVFATIKHSKKGSAFHESSQQRGNSGFSALDRGHSWSDEAFLQSNAGGGREQSKHHDYGPLYKSASLNRCLAFSEENILLGVSNAPKRAVSSNMLPSKGILKNKENHTDIRKTKSMEVLSPRVDKGQGPGQKGKEITQADIEQARANFLQEKLQFSAFLDEITKSVISPSDLTILGMNNSKTPASAPTSNPVKPQLPPKKHRKGPVEETGHHPKLSSRQERGPFSSSQKNSDCSNPDKLISYATRNHHGSPPPRCHAHSASQSPHHGSSHKDNRPMSRDRFDRGGPHLTDGTSTSPETSQSKQRHHHHHHHHRKQHHSQHPHNQHFHQKVHPSSGHQEPSNSPPSPGQGAGPGVGSESSSTKSDSPRARDTASTATSHSSDQSSQHQSQHVGHSQQDREMLCDADHLQALQEENADLHQNLLQTVVCIESLEAELQRTRDELSHVKEKYKSLLQTHTGTKQANNLLGEHLHIASESLSSERKYLLNRVSLLSSELEDAHRTITALENINVPCLIKELLEKHFDSAEAIQKFLTTSATNSHCAASQQTDGRSRCPKRDEGAHDWLTKSEAGPQRVTAFTPFKQSVPATGNEGNLSGQHELSHSPPFSVAEISTAIYKKMAASYAARPQPIYPQSQQQPSLATNHADTLPDLRQGHVASDNWGGKGELKVTLLEQDIEDVNSVSAQQILDDFIQHLQIHKEVGGRKEQQSGQKCRAEVTE